ncbi:MAG TPA: DNA-3-methyladenine glycosylase 2 family protein [Candidatus Paceibacterota bacterium]|nr:DNA-3-methyladenine glycosylase 2 family protein [Candidatus Paceibacterota bacterium]
MKKDVAAALTKLKKEPYFRPLIKKYGSPEIDRYHGKIDVFHALLRSIVYQQLSGRAAATILARVVALFPDGTPTPEALLKIRRPRLRKAGLSGQKVEYVRDLAKKCIDGTVDQKLFNKMTSDEIIEHVTAVKGIGTWTAHMLLIFSLNRLDILPVGDLAIRKGFQVVYKLQALPNEKEMEKLAKDWRAHASVASWYLWRVADEAKKSTLKKTVSV